eukprot:g47567.t1
MNQTTYRRQYQGTIRGRSKKEGWYPLGAQVAPSSKSYHIFLDTKKTAQKRKISLVLNKYSGFTGVTVQANGWIGGSLNDLSEFHMPDVSYLSLSFAQNRQETTSVVPDKDSTEADFLLYDSLTALGAVAVTDVPGFAEARLKALTGWSKLGCVCLGREFSLPDGTTRHTVAASSFGQFGPAVSSLHNVPPLQFADDHATDNKLRQACSEVVADLRLAVARASRDIFDSLDRTMRTVRYRETGARYGLPAMASPTHVWHNLTQLVDAGLFLDHLHSYSLTSEPKHTTTGQDNVATGQDKVATGGGAATYSQQTLPLHTDDGLFIAMTAGLYTAGPDEPFPGQLAPAPTDQCGLYMQLNDGPVVRALFEDGALLILAGQGAADWLFAPAAPGRPTRAARFRPVPHALVANGGHGRTRRNWYGRMFLPPMEARLPSGLSFAVYRERNAYLLSQQRSNKPEAEAAAATTTTRSTLPGLSELQAAAARSHGPARSEEQQQKIGENLPLLPVGCAEPDYLVAVRPHPPARQSVFEYVRPRDRVYVADGAQCTDYNGQAGIYCWTVCVSTANLQNPLPLTRSWCFWEIFCTQDTGTTFEICLSQAEAKDFENALLNDFDSIVASLCQIDVNKAQAFKKQNQEKILALVEGKGGGAHETNKAVLAQMRAWLAQAGRDGQAREDRSRHLATHEPSGQATSRPGRPKGSRGTSPALLGRKQEDSLSRTPGQFGSCQQPGHVAARLGQAGASVLQGRASMQEDSGGRAVEHVDFCQQPGRVAEAAEQAGGGRASVPQGPASTREGSWGRAPAHVECGQQAECVDFTQNNKPVDGTEMCPTEPHESSCGAICIGVSGGNGSGANSSGGTGTSLGANSNDFCTGLNGVSMLMDGFTWVSASKENLCINLLFTQWTLDSRAKFIVACFGMAALAIAIEWVSVARQRLYKHPRVTRLSPRRQRALQAAVHGLHGCLGYFLMLGAMTYAGELFLALLLGLSAGYFLMHPPAAKPPASAEPCCQIYQDSDDEAELQQVHQDVSAAVPPANSTSLADLATTTSTTATQTPTTKTATHTPTTKTAAVTDGVASYGGTAQNGAHHGSGAVHNGNGAAHNDRETAEQEKKSSALSDTLPLQLSLDSATTLPLQTLPQHNPHRPGSLTQSSRQSNETTQPAPSSSSSSSSKSDISLTSMRATRRSQSRTRTQSRHRTRTKSCCENEECNHRDNEERNHQAPHPNEGNESSEFTPPTLVVHEAPLPT